MIAFVLALVLTAPGAPRVVHSQRSPSTTVYVVDDGDTRILRLDALDALDQSEILKSDPRAVPMEYLRVATAALALARAPARALVIGTGAGTFPTLLRRHAPALAVDAVDIDPVVLDVAQRYFGLAPDAQLVLHVADGAAFVRQSRRRYDVVLLDAYSGDGVPAHLTTPAFFADVRAHMTATGVVALNLAEDHAQARATLDTFARTFERCVVLTCRTHENLVVLGGARGAIDADESTLRTKLAAATRTYGLPFTLEREVASVTPCASFRMKAAAPPP